MNSWLFSVPLNVLSLTVEDHFPNDATTGILMTLICQASPSNPQPSVTWQLARDGKPLALPEQSRTRSQVDGYGSVTLVSELALTADPRYENATVTCRASNTANVWITSNRVTLTVRSTCECFFSVVLFVLLFVCLTF